MWKDPIHIEPVLVNDQHIARKVSFMTNIFISLHFTRTIAIVSCESFGRFLVDLYPSMTESWIFQGLQFTLNPGGVLEGRSSSSHSHAGAQ